ncbi:hypothetical protein FRB95_013765 [Tulasnella sp. JGI-2019a]|nr:hypothetical protein FRB95_013765 [Tulasnella sp. JGI-2019a]
MSVQGQGRALSESLKCPKDFVARLPGFSQLPPEIVAKIFLFVLPHPSCALHTTAKQHYVTLPLLVQVSKGWRDIILSWPSLWVRVDSHTRRRIWSAALERSKLSPITVSMMEDDTRFWKKSLSQIGRWERATLVCSLKVISDLNERKMDAPELRVCTIGVGHDVKENVTLDLRGEMAPKLESLTLAGIALRSWDSTVLTHLQRLALYKVHIIAQDLMLALRECKAIVQLSLDQLVLSSEWAGSPVLPKYPHAILLGSLADLCIKDIESDVVVTLLAALETPRCTSFLLGSALSQFEDTFVPACIDYITSAASIAFASPARIEFICDHFGPKLRVRCDDRTWQFKILDPTAFKLITWVLPTFKDVLNRTPTEVAFDSLEGDHALLIHEPGFLNSLPRIETIRIGLAIRPKMLAALISALSRPQSGGEWEGRWLCPHLRHLHIEADYTDARALMGMLRNRKKSAGVVNALETLELSHESTLCTKTFKKIEQIAGLHVLRRSKAKEQETKKHNRVWAEYWTHIFEETWSMYRMREVSSE